MTYPQNPQEQRPPEYSGPPNQQTGYPIRPGHPNFPAPQQYPTTYVNTYQRHPDPNTEQAKASFFNAAKWGMWTWVAVTLVPIVIIVLCCGFCGLSGVIGAATTPDPTSSPW